MLTLPGSPKYLHDTRTIPNREKSIHEKWKEAWPRMSCLTQHTFLSLQSERAEKGSDWG